MPSIYTVACEVKVEADNPEEAQAKAEKFLEQVDESEVWSTEVGIAVLDTAETLEYRKLHRDVPGDIESYGVKD